MPCVPALANTVVCKLSEGLFRLQLFRFCRLLCEGLQNHGQSHPMLNASSCCCVPVFFIRDHSTGKTPKISWVYSLDTDIFCQMPAKLKYGIALDSQMSCLLLFFSSLRDKQTRKRREKQNIENFCGSFSQMAKRRHARNKRLSGYLPLEKRQKIDWLASKVWGLPFCFINGCQALRSSPLHLIGGSICNTMRSQLLTQIAGFSLSTVCRHVNMSFHQN